MPYSFDERAKLDYHNFGATFGGPIVKDRIFFFGSYERRKIERAPTSGTANTIDPAWLNDPNNANYVAPALRDPNAVKLLSAWPAPNTGTSQFQNSLPSKQNTTQYVGRIDWHVSPKWRLMGRYTYDLSQTTEPGGLFFSTLIPDIATTLTDVPGHVAVLQLTTTISPRMLNEFSFQSPATRLHRSTGTTPRTSATSTGSPSRNSSPRTVTTSFPASTSRA